MENNFEELQDDLKNLELIALNEKAENAVAVAGRHTGTADKTGKDRCQTVAEEAAADIRVEVAVRHHVDSFDMPKVFSDQNHNHRNDQDHSFRLENRSGEIGNSNPTGINQRLEVNRLAQSHYIGEQPVKDISNHNTHEDSCRSC